MGRWQFIDIPTSVMLPGNKKNYRTIPRLCGSFLGAGIHVIKLLLDFRAGKQQAVFALHMAALPSSFCNTLHAALPRIASHGSCSSHTDRGSAFAAGPAGPDQQCTSAVLGPAIDTGVWILFSLTESALLPLVLASLEDVFSFLNPIALSLLKCLTEIFFHPGQRHLKMPLIFHQIIFLSFSSKITAFQAQCHWFTFSVY